MRTFLFFILVFSLVDCINDKKVPGEIIPQEKMRRMMWDLMRADAYVSEFILKDSTKNQKTESVILYEQIFRMHSTTREEFEKSLVFYESRPDLLKPITDSLRVEEKRILDKQNEIKSPEIDSTYRKMKISNKLNPKSN